MPGHGDGRQEDAAAALKSAGIQWEYSDARRVAGMSGWAYTISYYAGTDEVAMSLTTFIGNLSHDEKLAAMDILWEDLSANPGLFVSPQWHERVLAERLAAPTPGNALGLAAAKAEVKKAIDARRTAG